MSATADRARERVVLVVEDDAIVCQYMTRGLADAGYHALAARSGDEAMTLLTSLGAGVIGLVVSDFVMPLMDGMQLASSLAERWPTIPFLMVSGEPPSTWEGPILQKPFTPSDLVTAVEDMLALPPSGARV
jgi:DNA-binding NtrC family response regulator